VVTARRSRWPTELATRSTATSNVALTTSPPTLGLTNGDVGHRRHQTAPTPGLPQPITSEGSFGNPHGHRLAGRVRVRRSRLESKSVNGERVGVDAGVEQGWNVYSLLVDIDSGETVVLEADLARVIQHPEKVVTSVQPMARRLEVVTD
jgi:hypothetical protein